jgi:mannose-6-phosphate isomerase
MSEGILKVKPHFVEKIWGGDISEKWYGYSSHKIPVGEVWCVCATKQFSNRLHPSLFALNEWIVSHPDKYPMSTAELPFRISIIDAKDDLSIQVHPTEEYAQKVGLESGLSEAWIILEAKPEARIQLGHHALTQKELKEKILSHQWDDLLRYQSVSKDDVYYIEAGTMHAVGNGILVYEISQAADMTYRIFDYDRIDVSTGKKRELHIDEALEVLTVTDQQLEKIDYSLRLYESYRHGELIKTRFFCVDTYEINQSASVTLNSWGFLTVISSEGSLNGIEAKTGDTFLVAEQSTVISVVGSLKLIFASIGRTS